jgi:hypothetical protein
LPLNRRKFTVREVWRPILKKSELQGSTRWDVLACNHSVPANDNRYRRARSCPECREKVQDYVDAQRLASAAADEGVSP